MLRMHVLSQVLWFALAIGLIVLVFDSVIRTFVLPRAATPIVTRSVFIALRSCFNVVARAARTYNGRDSVMSLFGPIGLLMLPAAWMVMVLAAYTAPMVRSPPPRLIRWKVISGSVVPAQKVAGSMIASAIPLLHRLKRT